MDRVSLHVPKMYVSVKVPVSHKLFIIKRTYVRTYIHCQLNLNVAFSFPLFSFSSCKVSIAGCRMRIWIPRYGVSFFFLIVYQLKLSFAKAL